MKLFASRALVCGLSLTMFAAAQCPPPGGYGGGGDSGPSNGSSPASPSGPSSSTPSSPSSPQPAGPSSPRPSGPASPGPTGPTTPRAGTPAAGPAGGATTPRGMPISLERGATSKMRLKVDWTHPVPPKRDPNSGTVAAGPLPLGDALDELWRGDDGRPLLVLRECNLCEGSDGALFSRSLANDKTMLMTKWFRTVKLPPHVAEKGHTFHNVFQGYEFEHGWPHFFLLAHKGAEPVAFTGRQTQSQLWRGMFDVLEQRYSKDPKRALKKWLSLLDKYDMLDSREVQLKEQLLQARAADGPTSSRSKKLAEKLDELKDERSKLEAQEKKVRELGLQKMPAVEDKVAAK